MFAALSAALDYVRQMGNGNLAAGRKALVDNAELCAAMTRAGVQALGLELFSPTCPAAARKPALLDFRLKVSEKPHKRK